MVRFDPGKHDSTVPSVICEVSGWLRTNDADVPDPVAPTDVSPVRKGETTEVVGMTAENICERDMLMQDPKAGAENGRPLVPTGGPSLAAYGLRWRGGCSTAAEEVKGLHAAIY
jgi:hypothetical protein